jgi:class 3 adenylate cyclase
MPGEIKLDGPNTAAPRRRLRAVFAADIANFSGRVSVSETMAYRHVSKILNGARAAIELHNGEIICMPGDGLLALFESAVDAVHCALAIQETLAASERFGGMRLRIGVHLGEVLFQDDAPFGEPINVAARLEALAEPGHILVSGAVVDAVSARVAATFEARGVPRLKNIPRRITTFCVTPAGPGKGGALAVPADVLDRTTRLSRKSLLKPSALLPSVAATTAEPVEAPHAEGAPNRSKRQRAEAPDGTSPPLRETRPDGTPTRSALPDAAGQVALTPQTAELLVDALAVHMGPVARVIVARTCRTAATLDDLIVHLEHAIPNPSERGMFRSSVRNRLRSQET